MATVISIAQIPNPFRAVAEYPPTLPYVGQDSVYHRLQDFTRSIDAEEQAHFMALYGDWAIGKSRLAHELIAQFCGKSVGWTLTTGQPAAPLLHSLPDNGDILPLFVPFVNAIRFEGGDFTDDVAIGKLVCAATALLASERRGQSSHRPILNALRDALLARYPNFNFDRLDTIATDVSLAYAERAARIVAALGQMTGGQVRRVLVIVDEVEAGGEVAVFAEAREKELNEHPIPARAVRDLYSGVKEASNTNIYPSLNFLFFNTEAARRASHLEALGRRMGEADLAKATATDLDRLIEALRRKGYPLTGELAELARRAFFAADRNFGWFSFIMNKAHQDLGDNPDLSIDEVFADVCQKTGRVFQPSVFEDRDIAPPALKDAMRRIIYNQAPTTLSELRIDPALRAPMLTYEDPFGTHFIGEAAVVSVSADMLTSALLDTRLYVSEQAPTLTGESSVRFDPAAVLDSLRTFAWTDTAATTEPRVLLWIYTDSGDFENQVRFAYRGFGENLSAATVRTIHTILLERCRVRRDLELVAPTMALLRRFNDLWGKVAANNWLREPLWSKVLSTIENSPELNDQRLLKGIANVLFDAPQPVNPSPYPDLKGSSLTLKLESYEQTFNVTSRNQLVILTARDTPQAIMEDLHVFKQRVPVLLIFRHANKLKAWRQYLDETRNERHLAIAVIPHVVEQQTREWEFYERFSMRGEPNGFQVGDTDSSVKLLRDEFGDGLRERFKEWLTSVEERGYVLRPFVPWKSATQPAFKDFARSWAALVRAGNIGALNAQDAASVRKGLEDYQRDQQNPDILQLTAGEGQALHALIPPVMPGVLNLLQGHPRKLTEIGDELFYVRSPRTANYPTNMSSMVEQVLALLQEIGMVDLDEQSRYEARTVTMFATQFDQAFQRLGADTGTLSGYLAQVASLSESVKALAMQLEVNDAQLRLLKTGTLHPQQERLRALPLDRLTALPPDAQAYTTVAAGIGEVSSALATVFGRPGAAAPPPIDPGTLQRNIDDIRSDKDGRLYSIEYRVAFLRQLQDYLGGAEQTLRDRLAEARTRAARMGVDFPERPVLALLDGAQDDLDATLPGNALPASLRQQPQDATLKVLKDAGRLSDVLVKLDWYTRQLDEQNADGWWARYSAARDQWQAARAAFEQTNDAWRRLEAYFDGTPAEHRTTFTGAELPDDMNDIAELVGSFVERENAPNVTLDDLTEEIKAIGDRCAAAESSIEAARRDADAEITQGLKSSNDEAVRHLAERLKKENILPDQQRALTARTHQEAHDALSSYQKNIAQVGRSLCDREELYEQYLRVYHDSQQAMPGDQIYKRHDERILRELSSRGLITIRNVVEV